MLPHQLTQWWIEIQHIIVSLWFFRALDLLALSNILIKVFPGSWLLCCYSYNNTGVRSKVAWAWKDFNLTCIFLSLRAKLKKNSLPSDTLYTTFWQILNLMWMRNEMTGNLNYVNLLSLVWKNSWNHFI